MTKRENLLIRTHGSALFAVRPRLASKWSLREKFQISSQICVQQQFSVAKLVKYVPFSWAVNSHPPFCDERFQRWEEAGQMPCRKLGILPLGWFYSEEQNTLIIDELEKGGVRREGKIPFRINFYALSFAFIFRLVSGFGVLVGRRFFVLPGFSYTPKICTLFS